MNHKKHIYRITAFLFAILLIYSCAKDDSQKSLPENNQNGKFTTKRVYFDEIENKEVLRQKIECFFDKNNSQGYRSKSTINNKNYILDTEKIAYIEDDSTHSYTMQLIDLYNPYKFINLLLSSSDGENYDMYRVDYNISEEEKQELIQGEYIDLNNKVRFTKIDENHFSNSYQTNSITTDEICYKIEIIESKCASGMHVHGDENCSYLGTDKEAPATFTIVITEVDCGYSGGGGGSGGGGNLPPSNPWESFPPGDPWQGNNPPSPPLGGGSGGGNIKNPPKNTTPVRNFTRFDSFYFSLMLEKPELWAWLKDTKNSEITEQIKNYINSNSFIIGHSMQEQLNHRLEFVEEAIESLINGGKVYFDFEVIIDPSFLNNSTLMNVFNQFGGLPTFGNYLKNFENTFSVAHLKLAASSDILNNVNALTSRPKNYVITITFNTNNLNKPGLSIARTMIHEMIHAEIFRKMLSCSGLPHVNFNNYTQEEWDNYIISLENNFPVLYDYYVNWAVKKQNPSALQHEMMAQHYRDIIVQALKEFDNNFHSEELYQSLAWVGLMNTTTWNNLSQTEKNSIILNIINFEN